VFLASFVLFGMLCSDVEEEFCDKDVHTIDAAERNGSRERYQTFQWFAISLIYYFCDFASECYGEIYQTHICIVNQCISITVLGQT
jgi:hypothetical protein